MPAVQVEPSVEAHSTELRRDLGIAKRVELATIHRTLETLRAAMNWGMAQTPPLRPQTRRHVSIAVRWRGHPHHPTDARPREHSADAALPERDGRGTQERTRGELEQQRPTVSTRIGSLKQSAMSGILSALRVGHKSITTRSQEA